MIRTFCRILTTRWFFVGVSFWVAGPAVSVPPAPPQFHMPRLEDSAKPEDSAREAFMDGIAQIQNELARRAPAPLPAGRPAAPVPPRTPIVAAPDWREQMQTVMRKIPEAQLPNEARETLISAADQAAQAQAQAAGKPAAPEIPGARACVISRSVDSMFLLDACRTFRDWLLSGAPGRCAVGLYYENERGALR